MELCRRAVEFVQVCNEEGEVRICGWLKDGGIIGRLTDNTMEEIYHSTEAELIREYHANKDYSNCNPNACPYVANNNVEENFIRMDEVPKLPSALYLAYENVCNYRCVMCGVHDCTKHVDAVEREKKLDKIDAELLKILPYVKKISANGLGELFVSNHILKLLSEWKPIAEPAECSVSLETNGSLFNERNWSRISNLGQYHLGVSITVLSFDEDIYQELSGTTLPLSNLMDNLYFVKQLREKGIINRLSLATVYQEKNFRELPQFVKRCLEEFSADYVRLRPVDVWGECDMQGWFRDVRNEYHPCHKEFLEVMKDPIFKHPKVHDWGGGQPSGLGPEPYIRTRAKYHLMENIFCNEKFEKEVANEIATEQVSVYGMTVVGKALTSMLKENYKIPFLMDRGMNGQKYMGISIFAVNHLKGLDRNVTVIVALDKNEDAVVELLKREEFQKVISINDLVRNCND
ncbi:MAG: radical SAM protein [Lachnospiraceae bacterium]|nr:radical SAM protein [Lachnospiraceae bacterium]